MFLAIAVDNLADAESLTAIEKAKEEEEEAEREAAATAERERCAALGVVDGATSGQDGGPTGQTVVEAGEKDGMLAVNHLSTSIRRK